MRPELVAQIHIDLDTTLPTPIPAQITQQIRQLITTQQLRSGDHLPSTRTLATQLGISRGSVVAAYEQLAAEGYVQSAHGSGTRIHPDVQLPHTAATPPQPKTQPTGQHLLPCTPGAPDTSHLITPTWRAAWRQAASHQRTPTDPFGSWELRTEISDHLRHSRGLLVEPAQICITAGAREGLQGILLALTQHQSAHHIGIETPGYPSLRKIPPLFGYQIHEIPTDHHGLRPNALPDSLDALLVTPSHQYPFGGSLSASRRSALSGWANRQKAWIIEDDFSSELRYEGQPLPTLTSLNPERCILLGTLNTILSPQLSCGYLVLPQALCPPLRELRTTLGQPVSSITQEAVTHLLSHGALRRHTQRMRRIYTRRRNMVLEIFDSHPHATLMPIDGGLHATVLCESPAAEVVHHCAQAGLEINALEHYWGGMNCPNGIVFGFGELDDATLSRALSIISTALTPEKH